MRAPRRRAAPRLSEALVLLARRPGSLPGVAALLLAAAVPLPGRAAAATAPADGGALGRLAVVLQHESQPLRVGFATLVLDEVIMAYELEFERLSEPGQVSRREYAKQSRWAGALARFLDELYTAREELDNGALVEILVQPPAAVQLLVGERVVPVSAPRIDDPEALQTSIAALFCDAFACGPDILDPPRPASSTSGDGWSFGDGFGSTYQTADGLGFMFSDVRQRARKEQACRQVRDDLLRLVEALTVRRDAGAAVDFDVLRLENASAGTAPRVVLSRSGASLNLLLPALARVPGVLEVARGWVQARVEGRAHRQLFPRADILLAGLLRR